MKKILNQKLQLKKTTIVKISGDNLSNLKGGAQSAPDCIKPSIYRTECFCTYTCIPTTTQNTICDPQSCIACP